MSTIGWIDYSTQLDSPGLRLVHLCPIYFDTDHVTAGSVGFYRQGTLFGHEMSHEPSVAATLDFKCEIPMCKAMAMQQPTGAVRSADNYTHCAEEGQFTAEARMMGMAQDAGCHCNLGRRALPLYAPFCIALIVVSLFRRRLTMRKSLFLIVLSLIVPACIHSGVETRAVAASTYRMPQKDSRISCAVVAPGAVKLNEPVLLKVTMTNTTPKPLRVFPEDSPVEGGRLSNDWFQVMREGTAKALPYTGASAMRDLRTPLTSSDYITWPAGVSRSVDLEITRDYDFTVPGTYTITCRGLLGDIVPGNVAVRQRGDQQAGLMSCNPVVIKIE